MSENIEVSRWIKALRDDEKLCEKYKASIAMAFFAEFYKTFDTDLEVANNLNDATLYDVAYTAAKNFLDLLLSEPSNG